MRVDVSPLCDELMAFCKQVEVLVGRGLFGVFGSFGCLPPLVLFWLLLVLVGLFVFGPSA